MQEKLEKVSDKIEKSINIPEEIKPIVKAICRGYIRESGGKIPLDGIENVCNQTFIKIDENDERFTGQEKILGRTSTYYDENGKVTHSMEYINSTDYIKLITILTHELGHVITEHDTFGLDEEGIYQVIKKTGDFYLRGKYIDGELMVNQAFGFRITDGFLESISTKIFDSSEFREELLESGYDLKDYIYKDERIFPSRIYDEYKAGFELFDNILDGTLFDFCCKKYDNQKELIDFINNNNIINIYKFLDDSNNSLWQLKKYEGKESDKEFENNLKDYEEKKAISLEVANILIEDYQKSSSYETIELLETYKKILEKQKLLPLKETQKGAKH